MKLTQNIKAIILAILVTIGISYVMADWTPAPVNPPDGNTSAPINVGTSAQVKLGNMVFGSTNTSASNITLKIYGIGSFDTIVSGTGLFSQKMVIPVITSSQASLVNGSIWLQTN